MTLKGSYRKGYGLFLWDKNGIFHRVYIIDVYYVEVRLYEIKKICGKELVYSAFFYVSKKLYRKIK